MRIPVPGRKDDSVLEMGYGGASVDSGVTNRVEVIVAGEDHVVDIDVWFQVGAERLWLVGAQYEAENKQYVPFVWLPRRWNGEASTWERNAHATTDR